MSNPVATIGNSIPTPADPKVSRKTYAAIVFNEQEPFNYAVGEYDPSYVSFDPTDKGQRFYIWVLLDDALGATPQFVSQEAWDATVKNGASGFLTGRYSLMPKLFIPNVELVDNGVYTPDSALAAYADPTNLVEAFNWKLKTLNGAAILTSEMVKYAQIGAYFGSQYVTVRAKNDAVAENILVMELNPPPIYGLPATAPASGPQGWDSGHELVVDGAFTLLLNVVPSRPAAVDYTEVQKNSWSLKFEFGDVIMEMSEIGALKVQFITAVNEEPNIVTVNLAEGKTKEGPPQQQNIDDKQPYVITVYPVWNGIIVMSGNQESSEVVRTSSTFVPMSKGRSVLLPPYSNGFDPSAPAAVEVGVGSGATLAVPDFGTKMTVTATNVRFEIAYLPTFFSREMWMDEWFVASDDVTGLVDFTYNVYPIWTANGLSVTLGATDPVQSSYSGPVTDTSYWYVQWRMSMTKHDRYAGEIFGSILEIVEERDFPIKNGNGNFNLSWTGGTPGDPSPGNWEDYIQSLTVSVSLDGSNGSITVDKYGVAGQDAIAAQSIGAITISLTGGYGTIGGSVFKGLGMGISNNESSDGATWEIPLVGLEKKLDDIMLINVPFFDGESPYTAIKFLTKYAGLDVDFSSAPNAAFDALSGSEDVNVARFDWKSGTSVKSALEDVMNDRNYNYVVRDGIVYIYELNSQGFPTFYSGTNWEPLYPDTKLVSESMQPDFEDLRNEIVVIGLQEVPQGRGANIGDIPLWPRFEKRSTTTVPNVAWAKSIVKAIPGSISDAELSDIADNEQKKSSNYIFIGRTSIPGNASIRPYDRWGNLYIYSVTHNLDFTTKNWTTELEFASST